MAYLSRDTSRRGPADAFGAFLKGQKAVQQNQSHAMNMFERSQNIRLRDQRAAIEQAQEERAVQRFAEDLKALKLSNEAKEYTRTRNRDIDNNAASGLITVGEELDSLTKQLQNYNLVTGLSSHSTDRGRRSSINIRQNQINQAELQIKNILGSNLHVFQHQKYGPEANQMLFKAKEALDVLKATLPEDERVDYDALSEALREASAITDLDQREAAFDDALHKFRDILSSDRYGPRLALEIQRFNEKTKQLREADEKQKERQNKLDVEAQKERNKQNATKSEREYEEKKDELERKLEANTPGAKLEKKKFREEFDRDVNVYNSGVRLLNIIEEVNTSKVSGIRGKVSALVAQFTGRNVDQFQVDKVSVDAWLEGVSQMKGALSDKEGFQLQRRVPKPGDGDEVFQAFFDELIEVTTASNQQIYNTIKSIAPDRIGELKGDGSGSSDPDSVTKSGLETLRP